MTAPALEVESLSYAIGRRQVLDRVSLTIAPGAFVVLLGPNGAGKTSLFSLLVRLTAGRGTIRIFGHDLRRQPLPALAEIGVVFQQPALDLDLTVGENLRYQAALHGLPPHHAAARAAAELARVGLADRAGDRARHLSGGQRRRAELARVLLHRPRLLLLDEPTVGLDLQSRQEIAAHVRRRVRDDGVAVLWATHLIEEVAAEDHVIVLDHGRTVAAGPAAAICAQAAAATLAEAFARLTARAAPQ